MRIEVDGLKELRKNLRNVDKQLPKGLDQDPQGDRQTGRGQRQKPGQLADRTARRHDQTVRHPTDIPGRPPARASPTGRSTITAAIPGSYPGNRFLTDTMREMAPETLRTYDRELTDWLEQLWVDSR